MFSKTPDLYDLIYCSFKDYRGEASRVADVLRKWSPNVRTVLDVGCGTGEHALHLRSGHGLDVHGLDIEPAFVDLARSKVPGARFWRADMADFDLDERFDAIICLFSSIGYLKDHERLQQAFRTFGRHLNAGGLVLVEPWFTPADWHAGRIYVKTADAEDLRVVRMSHSGCRETLSVLDFHYLIGRPRGIEYCYERHELGLFTREETTLALRDAGFEDVFYDPVGIADRGLYIAVSPR